MARDIHTVRISKRAIKDLKKVPWFINLNLQAWVASVGLHGLAEVRKVKGYHDELLRGDRAGQRSIRLNKAYRAIYIIDEDNEICFVEVTEVTKHGY